MELHDVTNEAISRVEFNPDAEQARDLEERRERTDEAYDHVLSDLYTLMRLMPKIEKLAKKKVPLLCTPDDLEHIKTELGI